MTLAVGAASIAPVSAAAGSFPVKTVRIVHAYPGGVVDAASRGLAERLSQLWKQPVAVDPKPGANELIAGDLAAKSEGDGHTLYIGTGCLRFDPLGRENLE
ncbi:MAG: hypothetical protein AB7P21_22545 [Lautropia sp.]